MIHKQDGGSRHGCYVENLVQKSTPRKRETTEKRGLFSIPSIKKRLRFHQTLPTALKSRVNELKKSYNDACKKKKLFLVSSVGKQVWKKYNLKRTVERELRVRWKYLLNLDRKNEDYMCKERMDAVPQKVKAKVAEFYRRPDISREIPSKKAIGKNVAKKYIFENSIGTTDKRWQEEEELFTESLSFHKMRPANVLVMAKTKHWQCIVWILFQRWRADWSMEQSGSKRPVRHEG